MQQAPSFISPTKVDAAMMQCQLRSSQTGRHRESAPTLILAKMSWDYDTSSALHTSRAYLVAVPRPCSLGCSRITGEASTQPRSLTRHAKASFPWLPSAAWLPCEGLPLPDSASPQAFACIKPSSLCLRALRGACPVASADLQLRRSCPGFWVELWCGLAQERLSVLPLAALWKLTRPPLWITMPPRLGSGGSLFC